MAIELVLDNVHPGNLGPLPPSPRLLLLKAYQLGLLSATESSTDPMSWALP